MTNTKITKKDRFNAIIDILSGLDGDHTDLIDFCDAEVASLDRKAVKAKETAAKKKAETNPLTEAVKAALATLPTGDYGITDDITAIVIDSNDLDDEVTKHKVSYQLSALVKADVAESADVKVAGGDGTKTRTVKGYRLVTAD